jgi:hypothetical protein
MTVPANGSTVRTGHGGKVTVAESDGASEYLLARVTQWSVSVAITEAAWADSDSSGYTNRTSGRRDITGTFTGKLDKSYPAYQNLLFNIDTNNPNNNDIVKLTLWEDANETDADVYWRCPRALVTGYDMTFDSDTRDPVEWSATFGADGVFYQPGHADTPNISLVSEYKPIVNNPN